MDFRNEAKIVVSNIIGNIISDVPETESKSKQNLCTRKAQSSRGVRSQRVHKIYYFGLL